MKRGKDGDKLTEPMFPRLSVNDAEKGGPRAPPRNKMALYEQLCTPAQRFNGGRFSSSHGMKPSNSVPPLSSKQVSNHGNTQYTALHVPPSMPTSQSERAENHSSRGMNLNSFPQELELRQNVRDEDDYTVPTYLQSDTYVHAPNGGSSRAAKLRTRPPYSDHIMQNMSSASEHNSPPMSNKDDRNKLAQMLPKGGFRDILPKGTDRLLTIHPCMRKKLGIMLLDKGGVDHDISGRPVRDNMHHGHQKSDPILSENAENSDDMSETSIVESLSGLDITPDDVVGVIGYKHFLKARKAIASQQRVFSVQVFELHRLIQVQRLIAGSPQIMVDDNAYVGTALKEPPTTKVPVPQLEYAAKPPVHCVKPKYHSEKPKCDAELTAENAVRTDGRKGTQLPNNGPFSGNVPPTPSSSDPHTAPWCFPQPSGHQWLVPIMSPSEGLIYKPYPGPGFMSPASGGFGPIVKNPDPAGPFAHGGFMNPPYGGFPTPCFPSYNPYPQSAGVLPGQNYFPPFSMPSGNPAFSSSSVDQMHHQFPYHPFPGPGLHGQLLQPTSEASNPNQLPNQSSCNLQKHSTEAASQTRKIRHPKENVLQGSAASSSLQRPQPIRGVTPIEGTPSIDKRNPFSLVPTTPATTDEASSPHPPPPRTVSDIPKVIKVVPHNAISATESAARIFQSIQRERKLQDTSKS